MKQRHTQGKILTLVVYGDFANLSPRYLEFISSCSLVTVKFELILRDTIVPVMQNIHSTGVMTVAKD